jgi:8-oxo-dGTP pyrophosphatase MutT (NUDIX family)
MKIIDKLAWIFIKDNKLLVVRSRNKSLYYIPGGKRDPGESDHQALLREIKEELSVDLIKKSIKPMGTFKAQADDKDDGVIVQLICYFADYTGHLKPAAEIAEMKWLSPEGMDHLSPAGQIVMLTLKNDLKLIC